MLDAPEEFATQLIDCPTCKETIEVPFRSRTPDTPKVPEPLLVPPPKPPEPPEAPTPIEQSPVFKLPPVEDSVVASFLTIIAALQLIAAPVAGLIIGSGSPQAGWLVFLSGVVSGLILLGFARVIENTSQSAQRLQRIEMLIQNEYDKKEGESGPRE